MKDPLLVATDGGHEAATALQFAAALSAQRDVPVEVISIVEPLSDLPMPLPHREELEMAHARGVADRVRQHVREIVGPVPWPIHVRLGRPAPAICTVARGRSASMVVLGVDESTGGGNAIAVELLHLADKPVLIAREGTVPRSAVVGIDFRPSSLRAADEAGRLLGEGGVLHLVHVEPSLDFPAASVWDWSRCYACAVDGGFQRLAERLARTGASIETHTRAGPPPAALMDVADELEADLLAIGSDGYICNGRVVVGRVARTVLAESPIAVLATPVATPAENQLTDLKGEEGAPVGRPA